ncbi:hypothetical protein OBO34_21145 [Clostridiales Family XIII bacterium ASD5510]|uniref:Uncharacterized protein n=1 Tax=Hominibacterium faecale TaxID=2839743 RepID=A0A9J6QZB8_9FIRM|nr:MULTISPECIES: hypothetical protein [Bacteria]MCU7380824.1 hypothetical protein [Hominibacterium faecale]
MEYTEYGLKISLEELEDLVKRAKCDRDHRNMEDCVYITGGEKPQIKQYCGYAECNPTNLTYGAK